MLERFALVIHWIGFVTGLILATVITKNMYLNITKVRSLDNTLDTEFIIQSALLLIPVSVLPLLLAWLIRYILIGKIHILPWR